MRRLQMRVKLPKLLLPPLALLAALLLCARAAGSGGGADQAAPGCRSALDCQLNGVCVDRKCECDAAWRGDHCSRLALLPAKKDGGYGSLHSATSSWGGGVHWDPHSGRWAMSVDEFDRHCGLQTYHHNSRIILAEATTADGPYRFVKALVDAPAMGATPARDPITGAWVVNHFLNGRAFAGRKANRSCTVCANGTTPKVDKPAHEQSGRCSGPTPGAVDNDTAIVSYNGSRGPWLPAPGIFNTAVVNDAGFFAPNGSLFIAVQVQGPGPASCGNRTNFIGVVMAESLADGMAGRWKQLDVTFSALNDPEPCVNWEGQRIWVDARGHFHVLTHAFQSSPTDYPKDAPTCRKDPVTGQFPHLCQTYGGHAYSLDARHWIVSPDAAYDGTVQYDDGDVVTFRARERPNVIVDQQTGELIALVNAVGNPEENCTTTRNVCGKGKDHSFTMVQMLRTTRRP